MLAEVVLTILAVIDGAGVLVKLSSKIPELLSIVRTVRTAEAASKAEGVAEAARVVEETKEVEAASQTKAAKARRNRRPSSTNKNVDQARTVEHADGSTTYYDLQGRALTYNADGYPDFSPYSEADVKVMNLQGTTPPDDLLANQAVGLTSTPDGYTWHHVEDGETMQLVPRDLHAEFPHTGGASIIRNR